MPYADPEQRRAYNRAYCQAWRDGSAPSPPKQALAERECEQCGEDFEPVRSSQRFCKPACRMRAHYLKQKADGTANDGFALAARRDRYRRQHGILPERWRGPRRRKTVLGQHKTVDARPFAEWLAWWMAQNDIENMAEAALKLDVADKTLREALDGKRDTLTLTFVTRALDRTGTGLWELYDPETLDPVEDLA